MATEYKYQFGARLQEILQLRSITQTELSEDSGVSRKTITRALRGDGGLTMEMMGKIALALHISMSELVSDAADDIALHQMTGIRLIDQALYRFCRMRSLPPGPERTALEDELHYPVDKDNLSLRNNNSGQYVDLRYSGLCASPLYSMHQYTKWRKRGYKCYRVRNVATHGFDLFAISLGDELKLNDAAVDARPAMHIPQYRPVMAYPIGGNRVSMIVESIRSVNKIINNNVESSQRRPTETANAANYETSSDGHPRGRTVLTEYTLEAVTFNQDFDKLRSDRPLQISYKHWALLPELTPKSVKLVAAYK